MSIDAETPNPTAVAQQRCSDQHHTWRTSDLFGVRHMRCHCGAVHPVDLHQFPHLGPVT
jgi:hypothetical protein